MAWRRRNIVVQLVASHRIDMAYVLVHMLYGNMLGVDTSNAWGIISECHCYKGFAIAKDKTLRAAVGALFVIAEPNTSRVALGTHPAEHENACNARPATTSAWCASLVPSATL